MPDTQPHTPVKRGDAVVDDRPKAAKDAPEADQNDEPTATEPTAPEATVAGVSGEFVRVAVDRAREGSHTFED